jgi:hypothetical protein
MRISNLLSKKRFIPAHGFTMRQKPYIVRGLISVCMVCVLAASGGCNAATPPRKPRKETVVSANRQFQVVSDPDTKMVRVLPIGENAQALWSFDHDVQLDQFVVSDDGENVAVFWCPRTRVGNNGNGIALRFWNRQKGEFKTGGSV